MIAAHRNSTETNVDVSDAIAGSGGLGVEVANAMDRVGSALGTGLTAQRFGAQDESDHIEFKAVGYKACMVAEANEAANPYYHSSNDYLGNTENGHSYIDPIYASEIVAGTVDYLAMVATVVPNPVQIVLMAGISTNGLFTLAFQGEAGRTYEIDASTNLANWDFVTNLESGDGNFQFTDSQSKTLSQHFFRALTR
jgi:cytochrome c1